MRLPQSITQSLSVRVFHLLTIGLAIALVGMVPLSDGQATPQLACAPASLRFGHIVVGQTESQLVTVTNSGPTSVTVSKITFSNPALVPSDVSLPLVLSAGQSAELSVTFTPTALAWTDGTVKFFSDASNATLVLNVWGTGVSTESATASPSHVPFGDVAVGASSTVPVVLTNALSSKVTLSSFQTTGNGFSLSGPQLPLTLDAGQSVTVNVTFAPQAAGSDGGSLFVAGPQIAIPLRGVGTVTTYSVNLFWNSSDDVVGYNVYRSTAVNGTYSKINSKLDSNTAYTDSTVVSGKTYYYAATSVNSSGLESGRSTPVQAAVP
jgi:Abnormal spindle-like microcephaly-assoc'd, ASPM-SPD-2-Hydin